MFTSSAEPVTVVRRRTEVEDRLVDFNPSPDDTPTDKLRRRAVRSIVSVLQYQDTQDRLEAETLELIVNGDQANHQADTTTVENNISIHAHLDEITRAVIDSTIMYGEYIKENAPDISVPGTISDAFSEVHEAFGQDTPQAQQVETLMPMYGLAPVNGQDYVGIRTANV